MITEAPTPEDAGGQINEVMANPKHPYFDPRSPMHEFAVADMQRLHAAAYPEPAPAEVTREAANPETQAPTLEEYQTVTTQLGLPEWERDHWRDRVEKYLRTPQTAAQLERGKRDGEAVLQQLWGEAFEEHLAAAERQLESLPVGWRKIIHLALERGLGNEVPFILRLAELGRKTLTPRKAL